MPRVYTKTKNRAGKERACGRCSHVIAPGERYFQFSFRYGGTHYRCSEHYPRGSELTQSKLSAVYAAVEDAEDQLENFDLASDIEALVQGVADTVDEVAEEYREAAEPFQGQGENAERADELESWSYELQSFSVSEEYDELAPFDEEQARREVAWDLFEVEDPDDLDEAERERWEAELDERRSRYQEEVERLDAAVEAARDEAREALSGCPL
jgi:hypothetical protein